MNDKDMEHLHFVRKHSPYYRELWKDAWRDAGEFPGLGALPVTDHQGYWDANTVEGNRLLTGVHHEGIVFKSGGTTGAPKFSFFSNEDWKQFCLVFGGGMRRGGLESGEGVANIFYGGQLYASLLFIGKCIEECGAGVNYPIAGFAPPDEIVGALRQFRIGTIAGVPTTIMNLIPALTEARDHLAVRKILYGGEAMYPDQIEALQKALPGCRVQSIGVAGVDYGELGWVDGQSEAGVHHVFEESTILEILDHEGAPIEEPGCEGAIYITNFRRRLMPVIRYPVGDMGAWIDGPGTAQRRFRLLGRTEKGARIGPMTLYIEDMERILSALATEIRHTNFQMLIAHKDRKDMCILRIAVPDPAAIRPALSDSIAARLYGERHMFVDLIREGVVHPLKVEWIRSSELLTNSRTGKMMRMIDRRHVS